MARTRMGLGLAILCASLWAFSTTQPATGDEAKPVRIGMPNTLFTGIPKVLRDIGMRPFRDLMKERTGMNGQILQGADAFDIGKKLNDDDLQLGVFQGVEFAWAQHKYGKLRPLMIAINGTRHLRALLVVHKDSQAGNFNGVNGQDLALPVKTREHGRLFLERECANCGARGPDAFFNKVTAVGSVERALDYVSDGKLQCALVDNIGLRDYTHLKSGRASKLKVIQESEIFPAGVIAYREGALDDATLKRFRDGMINANKNETGRELMSLFGITAFEAVPADYTQTLADILKAYPPQENRGVSTSAKTGAAQ